MRVLVISEASEPLRARLRIASAALYGIGLLALGLSAVGKAAAHDPVWGYGIQVLGVSSLWAGNVVGAVGRWRTTFVYLGFHLAFALFLLANPVISCLAGFPFTSAPERTGAPEALWLMALSLVSLRVGGAVIEYWYRASAGRPRGVPVLRSFRAQQILLIATLVTLLLSFVSATGAWLFVRGHSYAEYYTEYSSTLPAVLEVLGAASGAMVACYLAQFPRNRSHLVVLGALVVSTLPQLAMGLRSPFIAALVLAAAYTLLRWRLLGGVRARVPVAAVVAVALAVPVGMAGLGALNYARFDKVSTNGLDPVTDFVYSQSVSFSVVARGLRLYTNLPDHAAKHYSVGELLDYAMFGKPAQVLTGVEPLGGNTVRHATEGHELSHALSYYLYGQAYLDGRGSGSSYIVETAIDGGPALVLAFSLLLGALLVFLAVGYTRNWFRAAVMLVVLPGVFLVPRGNATGFLLPLLLPHFWLAVGFTLAVIAATRRGQARGPRWRHAPTRSTAPTSRGAALARALRPGAGAGGDGAEPTAGRMGRRSSPRLTDEGGVPRT